MPKIPQEVKDRFDSRAVITGSGSKRDQLLKLTPMERLEYWIIQRSTIYLKKQMGDPKPWTDDEILQNWKFTNVRRMDDKVSQWLLNNWYGPYYDHDHIPLAATLARFVNRIEPLEVLGFPEKWNPQEVIETLRDLRDNPPKGFPCIWSGAYVVRGNDGMDKVECVVNYYCDPIFKKPLQVDRDSMENTWKRLCPYYGFGHFMAGQVVADLRWALKGEWLDKDTWAPVGPGSMKGMNMVMGRSVDTHIRQADFQKELAQLTKHLHRVIPASIMMRLEAIDVQNTLCELSKYSRMLMGGQAPKLRYNGRADK